MERNIEFTPLIAVNVNADKNDYVNADKNDYINADKNITNVSIHNNVYIIEEYARYSVLSHIGKYTDDWADISPNDVMSITYNAMSKGKTYYGEINMPVTYNQTKFTEFKDNSFIVSAIECKRVYIILYDKMQNIVRVWGVSHDVVIGIIVYLQLMF